MTDWTAVGALGEVLGAAVVVASLLYLSRQIHQANRIARADAYRETMTRTAELINNWASDPEWAELFIQIRYGNKRRTDLSAHERAVAGLRMQTIVMTYAAIHHDVELGTLPKEAYDLLGFRTFSAPYMHDIWPLLRQDHSQEFAHFFEERFGLRPESDSVAELPPGSPDTAPDSG